MARYTIVTEESKRIKKALKKWGEIPISNDNLNGIIKIKNYRKYQFRDELDITFEGKVFVTIRSEGRGWHDSSILKHKGFSISIVRLNRFFRRAMIRDVQIRMNCFGVSMKDYYDIKKVSWE
jgi:hypothetical protein